MTAPADAISPYCLIVDDEPRLRQVLVHLMRGDGFQCIEAGNGVEALEQLERHPVTLVLSDLRMPKMDGLELLRESARAVPGHRRRHDHRRRRRRDRGELSRRRRDGLRHQAVPARGRARARARRRSRSGGSSSRTAPIARVSRSASRSRRAGSRSCSSPAFSRSPRRSSSRIRTRAAIRSA